MEPTLPPTAISKVEEGYMQAVGYSPSWVVFRPATLVDARTGAMWTLTLHLQHAKGDPATLVKLLLQREGGKAPLLALLRSSLTSSLPLTTLSSLFHTVTGALADHTNQVDPPPMVVVDQADLYSHLFPEPEQGAVGVERLQAALLELLLALSRHQVPPRQFLQELLLQLSVRAGRFYQLHQLLQYGVIGDSKQVACLLLSLEAAYPPARQLALDMMARLASATEEMIEIFLSEGKLIPALQLVKARGLVDSVSARKFLDAAERAGGRMDFFNVFNFFEERNLRLRGSGRFTRGEQCDGYVAKFRAMFLEDSGP